jgi:hypothetical protein
MWTILRVRAVLSLLAAMCIPIGGALADCSVGDTRAIVLDWEAFNPFWDEDATDSVLAALRYLGMLVSDPGF